MEGILKVKYCGCCEDLINILLNNGYSLTLDLEKDNQLKILYCKGKEEK